MNSKLGESSMDSIQNEISKNNLNIDEQKEDSAINDWKDTRLKKLEDFTKDLMNSAQKNSYQRNTKKEKQQENKQGLDTLNSLEVQTDDNLNKINDEFEDLEEDEMLLTKTEVTARIPTNALSSQRSLSQQQNGEFDKRITDIKQKLTQIRNTINSEIETSFNAINTTQLKQQSPLSSKMNTIQYQNNNQQNQSVEQSLDQFQNRLNIIKQNLNQTQQSASSTQIFQDKDRFLMVKTLIDQSYSQQSPNKRTGQFESTNEIKIHDQRQVQTQSHNDKEPSNLNDENKLLKKKITVMIQSEQRLLYKLEKVFKEQKNEKSRYEDQLKKMQEEMTKMCELIQEVSKNKAQRQRSAHNNCRKKQRINELEYQVHNLESQLKSQKQTTITQELNEQQLQAQEIQTRAQLETQVCELQNALKQMQENIKNKSQNNQLQEQLDKYKEENELLKEQYNNRYQEMLSQLSLVQKEMENKERNMEQRNYQLQSEYYKQIQQRDQTIEQLKQQNKDLHERILKIKDVFNMPESLEFTTNDKENQEQNLQKVETKQKIKKKQLRNVSQQKKTLKKLKNTKI